MSENVFINAFITIGMSDYFTSHKVETFEAHIVECLCDIYGEDKLRQVYEDKNEVEFTKLLHTYGLSRTLYDNFLRDTLKYGNFKAEKLRDPSVKSDIASKIEVSLIQMFLYKCLLIEPTLEEISHFENNLLNNFEMIKWHFNNSLNPNRTREVWNKKKRMLTDNVELVEIKPRYLDEFTYAKFGTSLQDVKKMDYRMVNELNKYIEDKLATIEVDVDKKASKPKNLKELFIKTPLSTGSGFTDAIMIASIIAAEMAIGIIYLFLHM